MPDRSDSICVHGLKAVWRGACAALLGAFRLTELKKQPFAYKALAVFWALALISTVLSDYVYESFWGMRDDSADYS